MCLAQSPRVKVCAAKDVPMIIDELKSMSTGDSLMDGCGGYYRWSSDCYSRSCPYCYYDIIKHTYSCHRQHYMKSVASITIRVWCIFVRFVCLCFCVFLFQLQSSPPHPTPQPNNFFLKKSTCESFGFLASVCLRSCGNKVWMYNITRTKLYINPTSTPLFLICKLKLLEFDSYFNLYSQNKNRTIMKLI